MHTPNHPTRRLKTPSLLLCVLSTLFFNCDSKNLPSEPPNPPDPTARLVLNAKPLQAGDPASADSCTVQVDLSIAVDSLKVGAKVYLGYRFAENTLDWTRADSMSFSGNAAFRITKTFRIGRTNGESIFNRDTVSVVAVIDTVNRPPLQRFNHEAFRIRSPIISIAFIKALEKPLKPLLEQYSLGGATDFDISIAKAQLFAAASSVITRIRLPNPELESKVLISGNLVQSIAILPNQPVGLACLKDGRMLGKFDLEKLTPPLELSPLIPDDQPEYVAATSTGDFAYVTSLSRGGKVHIFGGLRATEPIKPLPNSPLDVPNPVHVATGGVFQRGYVVTKGGGLYILQPSSSGAIEPALSLGLTTKKITVSPDETFAIVLGGSNKSDSVLFVDLTKDPPMKADQPLALGNEVHDLAISPDQRYIVVTNVEGSRQIGVLAREVNAAEKLRIKQYMQLESQGRSTVTPRFVVMNSQMAYILSCGDDCNISRVNLGLLDFGF